MVGTSRSLEFEKTMHWRNKGVFGHRDRGASGLLLWTHGGELDG